MCSPDSWFYDIFIFLKFHYEMQGNAPYRTCEARYVYADGSAYKGTWSGDSLDGEVHPQGAEAVGWSDWTESWISYNSLLISWISSHCSTISAYLMMQFPLGRVLADGQAAWPQREEYRGPQPKWATLVPRLMSWCLGSGCCCHENQAPWREKAGAEDHWRSKWVVHCMDSCSCRW